MKGAALCIPVRAGSVSQQNSGALRLLRVLLCSPSGNSLVRRHKSPGKLLRIGLQPSVSRMVATVQVAPVSTPRPPGCMPMASRCGGIPNVTPRHRQDGGKYLQWIFAPHGEKKH